MQETLLGIDWRTKDVRPKRPGRYVQNDSVMEETLLGIDWRTNDVRPKRPGRYVQNDSVMQETLLGVDRCTICCGDPLPGCKL